MEWSEKKHSCEEISRSSLNNLISDVEDREAAVARCVGFLAPVTRQFLAHNRVAGVQAITLGNLRRDNKYVVYLCRRIPIRYHHLEGGCCYLLPTPRYRDAGLA
jgi:hypothetical protein